MARLDPIEIQKRAKTIFKSAKSHFNIPCACRFSRAMSRAYARKVEDLGTSRCCGKKWFDLYCRVFHSDLAFTSCAPHLARILVWDGSQLQPNCRPNGDTTQAQENNCENTTTENMSRKRKRAESRDAQEVVKPIASCPALVPATSNWHSTPTSGGNAQDVVSVEVPPFGSLIPIQLASHAQANTIQADSVTWYKVKNLTYSQQRIARSNTLQTHNAKQADGTSTHANHQQTTTTRSSNDGKNTNCSVDCAEREQPLTTSREFFPLAAPHSGSESIDSHSETVFTLSLNSRSEVTPVNALPPHFVCNKLMRELKSHIESSKAKAKAKGEKTTTILIRNPQASKQNQCTDTNMAHTVIPMDQRSSRCASPNATSESASHPLISSAAQTLSDATSGSSGQDSDAPADNPIQIDPAPCSVSVPHSLVRPDRETLHRTLPLPLQPQLQSSAQRQKQISNLPGAQVNYNSNEKLQSKSKSTLNPNSASVASAPLLVCASFHRARHWPFTPLFAIHRACALTGGMRVNKARELNRTNRIQANSHLSDAPTNASTASSCESVLVPPASPGAFRFRVGVRVVDYEPRDLSHATQVFCKHCLSVSPCSTTSAADHCRVCGRLVCGHVVDYVYSMRLACHDATGRTKLNLSGRHATTFFNEVQPSNLHRNEATKRCIEKHLQRLLQPGVYVDLCVQAYQVACRPQNHARTTAAHQFQFAHSAADESAESPDCDSSTQGEMGAGAMSSQLEATESTANLKRTITQMAIISTQLRSAA